LSAVELAFGEIWMQPIDHSSSILTSLLAVEAAQVLWQKFSTSRLTLLIAAPNRAIGSQPQP
jgi:hypothetical protein